MPDVVFYPVCPVEELPSGERLFITFGDVPIVIFNLSEAYYTIEDVCTHDDGPLGEGDIEGHEVICPRHGARFDIRTGQVTALPAVKSVRSFPVRINQGMLEIGMAP